MFQSLALAQEVDLWVPAQHVKASVYGELMYMFGEPLYPDTKK